MSENPPPTPPVPPPSAPASSEDRPYVDTAFWFKYSGAVIESALTSRNTAAATLASFLVWLWPIYTYKPSPSSASPSRIFRQSF